MIKLSKQQHFKPSIQDLISEFDIYSFNETIHYHSHLFLGSKLIEYAGISGLQFTIWAPNLKAVSLAADFNNWSVTANPLNKIEHSGLWSLWIPNLQPGVKYQYVLHDADGQIKFINDPYATQTSFDRRLCSVVNENKYNWNDSNWIKEREGTEFSNKPISILSFDLQDYFSGIHTYQGLAKLFVEEAKAYGATHLELSNFLETIKNFNSGSDIYNEYHYFSPCSCFGAAEDLKCLIDYCHQNSLGVILEIPYFEDDNFSIFGNFKNLTKNQHKNFYLSNLVFWLEDYHIDGFNLSSIESLIFKFNHTEIKDFMQSMNETIHARSTGVFTYATDPTGFPGLTKPSFMDGIGFNMKTNLAWLNEMKKFFAFDGYDISDFIYSTINIFAENFVLSLGDSEKNWEDLGVIDAKLLLAFYFLLPGKKYISYGFIKSIVNKIKEHGSDSFVDKRYFNNEYIDPETISSGQILLRYLSKLNSLYKNSPTLYETDFRESRFEWLDYDENSAQASFIRWSKDYKDFMVLVFNFSDEDCQSYSFGVPRAGYYKKIFDSNSLEFCGSDFEAVDGVYSFHKEFNNRPYSLVVDLAAESVKVFQLAK